MHMYQLKIGARHSAGAIYEFPHLIFMTVVGGRCYDHLYFANEAESTSVINLRSYS